MTQPPGSTAATSGGPRFVCPVCRGSLREEGRPASGPGPDAYRCTACGARYPVRFGIPDFRIEGSGFPETEIEADLDHARFLLARYSGETYEGLIRYHYRLTFERGMKGARSREEEEGIRRRVEQYSRKFFAGYIDRGTGRFENVRGSFPRLRSFPFPKGGHALDVGCGWGTDLIAFHSEFESVHGIDLLYRGLILTRKLLEERGAGNVALVAGSVDALPYPDASFDYVNANAVIEHTEDAEGMIEGVHRVLRPGGAFFFTSANRYSLFPELHTGVWGVGFLPRRWMAPFVYRMTRTRFEGTWLLSWFDLERLLAGRFQRVYVKTLDEELAGPVLPARRLAGRVYNTIMKVPLLSDLANLFVPAHKVLCRKVEGGNLGGGGVVDPTTGATRVTPQ